MVSWTDRVGVLVDTALQGGVEVARDAVDHSDELEIVEPTRRKRVDPVHRAEEIADHASRAVAVPGVSYGTPQSFGDGLGRATLACAHAEEGDGEGLLADPRTAE